MNTMTLARAIICLAVPYNSNVLLHIRARSLRCV